MLLRYIASNQYEAGVDEAGRGCLAGAVFAAAVLLPESFFNNDINDSKKLKPDVRYRLAHYIKKHALAYSIAYIENVVIDKINILEATYEAMHKAIDGLAIKPKHLAIDGNRFKPYKSIPHTCCIKGDARYHHIAAASILAKTARDIYMQNLHKEYPQYDWEHNKGYGTKKHYNAIEQSGITPYHRKSFLKHIYPS